MITKLFGAIMLKLTRLIVRLEDVRKERRITRIYMLGGVPRELYDNAVTEWEDCLKLCSEICDTNEKLFKSNQELLGLLAESNQIIETLYSDNDTVRDAVHQGDLLWREINEE